MTNINNAKLTMSHGGGHAFLKVQCSDCFDGGPAILSVGLYPPVEALAVCTIGVVEVEADVKDYQGLFTESYYVIRKETPNGGDKYSIEIDGESSIKTSFRNIHQDIGISYYERSAYSKGFNISSEAATMVLDRVLYLYSHCDRDYSYKTIGHNCIDFAQEMYELAGLEGNHFDEMYSSYSNYPANMLGAYGLIQSVRSWIFGVFESIEAGF